MNPKDKIRILIADKIDLSGIALLPKKHFSLTSKFNLLNKDILKYYNDFDVLVIRTSRIINKNFLKKCKFRIIATCSKGTDHIDLNFARRRKIHIINSDSGNTVSTAEHTFALILNISKNILVSDQLVRDGRFSEYDFKRTELRGKKIGIIGFGRVGSRVAKIARAFEMIVYANDIDPNVRKNNRNFEFKNLRYLLKNADIVTIHIPLNKNNVNFINSSKLKLLNDKTILINTSRGDIIDEKYLLYLLDKGKLYFAGLDVFKNEPKINKLLFCLKNVILTNHVAGKTEDSLKYISNDIFMQVKKFFSL